MLKLHYEFWGKFESQVDSDKFLAFSRITLIQMTSTLTSIV